MRYRLQAHFTVITPLGLGGVDAQKAEWRAPALKSLLRFWFRAVQPQRAQEEAALFGGAGKELGQGVFSLRLYPESERKLSWKALGVPRESGLHYLGYPFELRGNEGRTFMAPGSRFLLEITFHRQVSEETLYQLAACVWLLGHVGAAGSRARRGFGALTLTAWELRPLIVPQRAPPSTTDSNLPDLNLALPLLVHQAMNPVDWEEKFRLTVERIQGGFGVEVPLKRQSPPPRHPYFGENTTLAMFSRASPPDGWDTCLEQLGSALKAFRSRYAPDTYQVAQALGSGGLLEYAPQRASFGLPLTFRFIGQRGTIEIVPYVEEDQAKQSRRPSRGEIGRRQASLLLLRPVQIKEKLYPLLLRMDGAVPGVDDRVAIRHNRQWLRDIRASEAALDKFMAHHGAHELFVKEAS